MDSYKIIKYPLSTEKTVREQETSNSIIFVVDSKANKSQIKTAVEKAFDVKVINVRTMIDNRNRKKAYVQLSADTPAIDITSKLGLV